MKSLLQDFINELTIYWLYLKEIVKDIINPKPPTGMV